MAGNVWEWVHSRCLRGGSFDDNADDLRCAFRYGPDVPDYRDDFDGFRVCVSPV
jgi:formylglycine-generating enzyme required for sulfatase activity